MNAPKPPRGLKDAGTALWRQITGAYAFDDSPEALYTLESACRTADVVARLQDVVDNAEVLTTRGSQGQQVALPHLTELRQYRNLMVTLVKSMNLPAEEDTDSAWSPSGRKPMSRTESARKAAQARWAR
jgi:hypothetical protein